MAENDSNIEETIRRAIEGEGGAEMPPVHLRPTVEYEDITLREITIGFPSGPQDMTLYPEDTMEIGDAGEIKITFVTLGGGEFVAYPNKVEWYSFRETPHRRVKGTLRPDAKKMLEEMQRERRDAYLRRRKQELESFEREYVRD